MMILRSSTLVHVYRYVDGVIEYSTYDIETGKEFMHTLFYPKETMETIREDVRDKTKIIHDDNEP